VVGVVSRLRVDYPNGPDTGGRYHLAETIAVFPRLLNNLPNLEELFLIDLRFCSHGEVLVKVKDLVTTDEIRLPRKLHLPRLRSLEADVRC